jgi:CARDB
MKYRVLGVVVCFLCFASQVYGDSSFDRELVIKNQGRADKAETVFRSLIRAYENEDAREFLDYVSEDRFRQDYLTFTDALYSDFRTYEIFRVDYWVDRVVPDNVKQFFYVRWEKRYETLDDAQQLTQRGFSRFLFDEVNGEYLLVELAGNDLFGASLAEWTDETPSIPGEEAAPVSSSGTGGSSTPIPANSDLTIQGGSEGYSPDGSMYQFQMTVINAGTGASLPTTVAFRRSNGTLDQQNIPALSAGATYPLTSSGYDDMTPVFVQSVTIDPTNTVPESNEANNTGGPYFL